MTITHTPGPWAIIPSRPAEVRAGDAVVAVAQHIWHDGGPHAETRANAALVSAAPDLLAVVEDIVSEADRRAKLQYVSACGWDFSRGEPPNIQAPGFEQARAAIAKARGEG